MTSESKFYQRQIKSTELSTMLGSVGVNSLYSLYKEHNKEDPTIPKEKRNRDGISNLLRHSTIDKDLLLKELYREEANRPFRHIFFSRYEGQFDSLSDLSGFSFEVENIAHLNELGCVFYEDTNKGYKVYTFDHKAKSTHWYWSEDGGHYPENIYIRHPLTVHIFRSNFILVSFPGYTRARNEGDSLEYITIIKEIFSIFERESSLSFSAFTIKNAIDSLLKNKSTRLRFTNLRSRNQRGGFDLFANDSEYSIENLLPSLMVDYLPGVSIEDIENALVNAILDCEMSSTMISWIEEEVSTKIKYHDEGTELYFSWNRKEPSYDNV